MNGPLITCSHPGCTVVGPVASFTHGDEDRGVYCARHCSEKSECDACIGATYGITGVIASAQLRSVEREIADVQHEVSLLSRDLIRLGEVRLGLMEVAVR